MKLSERESSVLKGIGEEKSYAQIAEDLNISRETVKVYVKRLRTKTGANGKVGLALYYARNKETV